MSRRIRLPQSATEDEVYELSLKYVKWLLITQQVDVDTKIKAVQMGMRLRTKVDPGKAERIESELDSLVARIFDEHAENSAPIPAQ